MKIQHSRLITAILAISLAAGLFCLPAGAAVRSDAANMSAVEPGKAAVSAISSESLIDSTESHTSVDLSGATWKRVGSNLRLQSSSGKYKTGFVTYKNKLYYFDSKGNLKTGFFTVNGKKYFASTVKGEKGKGQILTGLVKINGFYYYLSLSSSPKGAVATGFQKISGRRYYFKSNGHMVTGWFTANGSRYYASCNKKGHIGALLTGVQKIGNTTYRFDSKGKLLGVVSSTSSSKASSKYMHIIDVSEHQGSIDFKKVKAAGVKGVMIRAGYGKNTVDKYFYQNIKNAKAAGLSVGVYWFSYAATRQQAIREANFCLKVIKPYKLELPVFFDWEYDSMRYTKVSSRNLITDMTSAFCSTITNNGRRAGYYFNLTYLNKYYNPSKLTRYATWYAYWGTNKPGAAVWTHADTMAVPKQYDLWQFTSRGKIAGVSGYTDCNLLLDSSIKK